MKKVKDKYLKKYGVKDIHGLNKGQFLEYLNELKNEKSKMKK